MSDLISRQAAIDALEREKSLVERPITETRWFDLGLGKAQDILSELPSAQPETPPYVAEIESEYKKWVKMPHINKPLAKALYEVWKKHDREDVSRNG